MAILMSPAGDEATAYAAFEAGADAVYLGTKGWSRRTSEFELDDVALRRCLKYSIARNKEIRLTVNVYYQARDIDAFLKKFDRYYSWGLRHLIITDIGMIKEVHKNFPDVKITASVAAGVCNAESAKFYKNLGVSEVVLPVSVGPKEAKIIKDKSGINIEVFVHGHFDYNQCGHCWMSSYFNLKKIEKNRNRKHYLGSVNRGGCCFRVCQIDWKLVGPDHRIVDKGLLKKPQYHYYSLDTLKGFIDAGVTTFKIKGRTYTRDFVVSITRFYRDILDTANSSPGNLIITDRLKKKELKIEKDRLGQFCKRTQKLLTNVMVNVTDGDL